MPTYEYACRDCSEHLEVVQSFRDDPLEVCPRCSGRLRKVFSAAGIIFKGSGYYVTDTRKSPAGVDGDGEAAKQKSAKESSKSEPGEKSGSSSPPDSKSSSSGAGTDKQSTAESA